MHVVIAGAGAIGAAAAFFLAERGVRVTVVERHAVAGAASGKAGGFLARDWCRGTALDALARRSFALHAELARRFDNPWDHRRLDTYAVAASARRRWRVPSPPPAWLAADAVVQDRLGTTETTAQVHPERFTRGLLERAPGVALVRAAVTGLLADGARIAGLATDRGPLEGEATVLALGPWTGLAGAGLGLPTVGGLQGSSIVLATGTGLPAHAVFAQVETAAGEVHDPEVFTRSDGTTYVCGLTEEVPLPVDPAAVAPTPDAETRLRAILAPLAPALAEAPLRAVQACFRPVTADGLPLMGAVEGRPGAFVAAGHGVWGILNAPASGEAMAALVTGDEPAVDLRPFAPAGR